MAASDPARRHRIARAGAAARHRLPTAGDRRAEVATDTLAAAIERVVAQAPPLNASQRDRLASLLRPTAGTTDTERAAS